MAQISTIITCLLMEILPWFVLITAAGALVKQAYSIFGGPLSGIPSVHWLASWTSYHNHHIKYFHNARKYYYEAHKKYGDELSINPIVRVGPNEVSITSGEAVKTIFGGGFERSTWYSVFSNFG